jgi:MFS family permease
MSVALLMGVGSLVSIATPVLLHTMQHDGLSATIAGTAITLELLAMAVSTMMVPHLFTLDRRIAIWGCLGAALTTLLSGFLLFDPVLFIGCRMVCGLFMGLVAAGSNSQLSISKIPDRVSAFGVIGTTAIGVIALILFPRIGDSLGPPGVFGGLAVVYLLGLLCARRLQPVAAAENAPAARAVVGHYGWALVAALFLLNLSDSIVYNASEAFARNAGLLGNGYSAVLAAAAIAGVVAAGATTRLNLKLGRRVPVFCAIGAKAVASLAIVYSLGFYSFSALVIIVAMAHFFALPYLFGASAALDPSGRTAVLATGAFQIGGAIGPLVSVAILENSGPIGVGVTSAICLLLTWIVARRSLAHSEISSNQV